MSRRLLIGLGLLLALVLAAVMVSDGGDDGAEPTVPTTRTAEGSQRQQPQERGAPAATAGRRSGDRALEGAGDGDHGSANPPPRVPGPYGVDLATRPEEIPSARVTGTGAVQTLPPDPAAHETAQENSYGSIRAFGEEAGGTEATDITFALVQFLTAKAERDWATACARLYSPLIDPLLKLVREGAGSVNGCPEALASLLATVPDRSLTVASEVDVSSIRRGENDRAFVIYKTPDTLSVDMPMFLEDGAWKVGALEAYALTPEQLQASE